MRRILLAAGVGAALGAGGLAVAQQAYHGPERVRPLSERDIAETVDGKKARATMVEVTLEPGQAGRPHRHPGPVFGYVLEGEFELGLGEEAPKVLKAGETFYEPSGALHRVGRNPSARTRTRVLAVVLHPRDAKEIVTPAGEE
jgi:quercetin dioxygenase-like cupin family protein